MEFRVLGPLDVRVNGDPVALGGPKQRALLAMLLLSANRVVARDRLIEELWPGRAPGAADHTLRVHVSRLRKALGGVGGERVVSRPPGYLLRVEPDELDLHRFEDLVAAGSDALEAGDPEMAARRLREAEALWHGRPLADLEFEPFARVDIDQLEEQRLAAVEARIDAELELGREAAVVPELDRLITEHPLRERLRAQLMRALYSSARQAEALAVYADARKMLVDQLGIEPSEDLCELERKILNQDPTLRSNVRPRARATPEPATAPAAPEPRRRRGAAALAVAAVLVVVAAGVATLRAGNGAGSRVAALRPDSIAFLDAHSGELVGQIPVGPTAGPVRFGAGFVWKLENDGRLLEMLDPHSFKLVHSIPTGVSNGDVVVGARAVWVSGADAVVRIDPTYGSIARRIDLPVDGLQDPSASSSIAVGAGSLWVSQGHARVLRLDPATGRVEHRFDVPNAQIVRFGDGAVWVAGSDLGTLTRIDPDTDTIAATARIGPSICCLAVGGGYSWATNDTGLWKVSASGDPAATIRLPNEADFLTFGDGAAWVTVKQLLLRVDAATSAVKRYRFAHPLNGIAVDRRRVAVSVASALGDVLGGLRGDVLNAGFGAIWFDVSDPAVSAVPGDKNWPTEQQLQHATCAPLLRYPDGAPPGRWELIPEVAAALPSVSPDGRTYTFTIRTGFRFSPPSNAPVTAGTFKYSMERALSPQLGPRAPALRMASDITGLRAYRTGAAAHVDGIKATGDRLTITLARSAPDFTERVAATYFCPVPPGTPAVAGGLQDPIPSAGPYYLSANHSGTIAVLRPNPNYHGARPQRLDGIVFRQYAPIAEMIANARAGRTDYVAERATDLAPDGPLARRYSRPPARRYFLSPLLGTDELLFARRGLLSSTVVRRAINLALDHQALARAMGDLATDRYLPPGMPGAASTHVAPPDRPDLRRARALIGERLGRLRLAVCQEPACLEVGRIVRANLRRIGLRVALRTYGGDIAPPLRRHGADITLARVLASYPEPVAFLKAALGDAAPSARLARISHMDRPQRLAATNQLDLALLHSRPPAAAFGTPAIPEFFSARIGCQRFSPVSFGVDLGALCLQGR